MHKHIKGYIKKKNKDRASRDMKVAAAWQLFKDFDQDRLWGPCGGDRSTEWTAGPGQELFNLENLSILLTQMSEEGIWNDETLRMVYDRAAYHNEVCTERDHDEWQAEQDRWLTFETSDEGEP